MYTIEYQKQGLPHIHLLLFLPKTKSFRNPDRVDEIISAELLSPKQDPSGILFETIKTVMIY